MHLLRLVIVFKEKNSALVRALGEYYAYILERIWYIWVKKEIIEVCCLVVGTLVLYYVFKKQTVFMRSGVDIFCHFENQILHQWYSVSLNWVSRREDSVGLIKEGRESNEEPKAICFSFTNENNIFFEISLHRILESFFHDKFCLETSIFIKCMFLSPGNKEFSVQINLSWLLINAFAYC